MSFVGVSLLFKGYLLFVFFFSLGGGRRKGTDRRLAIAIFIIFIITMCLLHFSRASDKEPPVHFGKEKEKNDELAMSLERRQIPAHSTCARI